MKKLIALLAAASGLPQTALASCVNDDGSFNTEEWSKVESKIKDGIEAKLENARKEAAEEAAKANDVKGTFDDGFKKGEAKVAERIEKRLREAFGVEEKLSGDELFKAIAANKDKPQKEITQDQVERLPWYQEHEEKRAKAHKEEIAKLKGEYEEFKKSVDRKDRMAKVNKLADPIIESLNLNLSKDPERRAKQIEAIREKIHATDYDIQDERVLVLKDGKVLKDKMDNSIVFKDHITAIATDLYDPLESKERESTGVKTPAKEGDGKKSAWTREMPKNDEQYQAALLDPSISVDERAALMEAYGKS